MNQQSNYQQTRYHLEEKEVLKASIRRLKRKGLAESPYFKRLIEQYQKRLEELRWNPQNQQRPILKKQENQN